MYCFSAVLYSEKDQFVKSNTEKFRAYRNRKKEETSCVFQNRRKNNTGAAGALSFDLPAEYAAAFLAGSVLILNRTQRQVYEQLEEISKLYTDELDNRFFRISRNLLSTVMDRTNPDSAFWKYMDLMEKDQYEEYVITQLRRNYVSAAWDFGTDYNVFLYTKKDESLYQLSISSDGLYAVDPYLQEALKRRIKSLSQQAYAVKKNGP